MGECAFLVGGDEDCKEFFMKEKVSATSSEKRKGVTC